ncbi:MAG: hypothetical protein AAB632_01185 [Patescibacteria group bacterium]
MLNGKILQEVASQFVVVGDNISDAEKVMSQIFKSDGSKKITVKLSDRRTVTITPCSFAGERHAPANQYGRPYRVPFERLVAGLLDGSADFTTTTETSNGRMVFCTIQ